MRTARPIFGFRKINPNRNYENSICVNICGVIIMSTNEIAMRLEPRPATIEQEILALRPALRAFAMSLCHKRGRRGRSGAGHHASRDHQIDSFQPGTNLGAWLATILRNCYRSERRKRRYEVEDTDGLYASELRTAPEQEGSLEFKEFRGALTELPFQPARGPTPGRRRGPFL